MLISPSVSNYIQEVSVTPAVEKITVLCTVTQSNPVLICSAVFYCFNNGSDTSIALSSGITQDFLTTQSCNVTIQVVMSGNPSQVLQQEIFYDVTPLVQPSTSGEYSTYSMYSVHGSL